MQTGRWAIDIEPAEALKSALVSTAIPHEDLTVYEQGGGRLDAERALTQNVFATPAPLDIGHFEYPHDDRDPVTKHITYHNMSDEDVTLGLSDRCGGTG